MNLNQEQIVTTNGGQIANYLNENNQEFGIIKMIKEVVSANSII